MIMYEKISLISEKDYNKVWLANIKNSDTLVVVKELSHANTDVLESIASINDIHIPHILSHETTGDITTVVEEYISGLTLNNYINEKQLSEAEIIKLISQVCDGLRVIHSQNPPIIHKDLKPSNIIVSSDGIVKIIDFDAARKYKENADTDTCHLGTAAFASPEHYGYSQTDERSDIYSLGAVMYELFSGKQLPKIPAKKTFDADELYNSTNTLSKKLIHIIQKCTMFNPSARYQNIDELQHELNNYNKYPKKLFTASAITILALFCFAVGFAIFTNHRNKATSAEHITTNAPTSESALNDTSYQPEAQTDIPDTAMPVSASPDITDKNNSKNIAEEQNSSKINKKTTKSPDDRTKNSSKSQKSDAAKSTKYAKKINNNQAVSSNKTNENIKKATADKNTIQSKRTTTDKNTVKNKKNTKDRKNSTTGNNNKTNTSTPAPNKTTTPELSSPVTVNLTGKIGYYLDSYNKETGSSIMFVFFYLRNKPSLTPLNVGSDVLNKYKVQKVYIEDTTTENTYAVPAKYWSLMHNQIVKISDKFLSVLELNNTYKLIIDCDNAFITAKVKIIENLNMVTVPFNQFGISPGCFEYEPENPAAQTFAFANAYGRTITKITIPDLDITLSTKYYSIDPTNTYITFKKSFFKKFCNGSGVTVHLYHNKVANIKDDFEYSNFTFYTQN